MRSSHFGQSCAYIEGEVPLGQEKFARSFGQETADGIGGHLNPISKKLMDRPSSLLKDGALRPRPVGNYPQLNSAGQLLIKAILVDSFDSRDGLIQLSVGNKPASGGKE